MKKKKLLRVQALTIVALFLGQLLLFAQDNSWHRLTGFNSANSAKGLSQGHNNTSYAHASNRWIYYSTDNGDNWVPFNDVPAFLNAEKVKASPSNSRVFCTTTMSGIAFTDDYGNSWTTNNFGLGGNEGSGPLILAHGAYGQTVVASVTNAIDLINGVAPTLYVSYNNGNNFTDIGSTTPFQPLDFHFKTQDHIFTNTFNDGIYANTALTSSGQWQQLAFAGQSVNDLFLGSSSIYAVVAQTYDSPGTIYKSDDDGATWQELNGFPVDVRPSKVVYDEGNQRVITVTDNGIYAYENNVWTQISTENKASQAIITADQSVLFSHLSILGVGKVNASDMAIDYINEGLRLPTDFIAIPGNNRIYTASQHAPFVSEFDIDNMDWATHHLFESIPGTRVTSMGTSSSNECIVGGIHYLAKPDPNNDGFTIFADSTNAPVAPVYNELFPQKLWLGNNGSLSMVQHATQDYVDYTENMGQTWNTLYDNDTSGFTLFDIKKVCSGTQTHFIMGTFSQDIILQSQDNGANWSQLPNPGGNMPIEDMYIDRVNTLYAVSTNGEVHRWNETGGTWAQIPVNTGGANKDVEIAFDFNNDMYIISRTTTTPFPEEGIHYSEDGGQTFTHTPFPSTDQGELIRLQNLAFINDTTPIASTFDDDIAYTDVGGIYYLAESAVLSASSSAEKPLDLTVYPNPATDFITIKSNETATSGKLITMTGKVIPVTVSNNVVDVSTVNPGLYVLQFELAGTTHSFKVIVEQ